MWTELVTVVVWLLLGTRPPGYVIVAGFLWLTYMPKWDHWLHFFVAKSSISVFVFFTHILRHNCTAVCNNSFYARRPGIGSTQPGHQTSWTFLQ